MDPDDIAERTATMVVAVAIRLVESDYSFLSFRLGPYAQQQQLHHNVVVLAQSNIIFGLWFKPEPEPQ